MIDIYEPIGNGYSDPNRRKFFNLDWIIHPLLECYEFRKNVLLDQLEVKRVHAQSGFSTLDARMANNLILHLNSKKVLCEKKTLLTVLNSDTVSQPYNPIEDYFTNLPAWDGTDYIQQVADSVETEDHALFTLVLKKWLVALVKMCNEERSINPIIIVLVGGKELDKSNWIRSLVPNVLEDYYYAGVQGVSNRENLIRLAENLIINLIEPQNLGGRGWENVKSYAPSYSKIRRRGYTNKSKRVASLIASVSQKGAVKTDIVGNKRVFCFDIVNINIEHDIPIDKLYAQAKHLYNEGESASFTSKELDMANIEDTNQIIDIVDLVDKYIDQPSNDVDTQWNKATDILTLLFELDGIGRKPSIAESVKLGRILSERGFKNKMCHGTKKYSYEIKLTANS